MVKNSNGNDRLSRTTDDLYFSKGVNIQNHGHDYSHQSKNQHNNKQTISKVIKLDIKKALFVDEEAETKNY